MTEPIERGLLFPYPLTPLHPPPSHTQTTKPPGLASLLDAQARACRAEQAWFRQYLSPSALGDARSSLWCVWLHVREGSTWVTRSLPPALNQPTHPPTPQYTHHTQRPGVRGPLPLLLRPALLPPPTPPRHHHRVPPGGGGNGAAPPAAPVGAAPALLGPTAASPLRVLLGALGPLQRVRAYICTYASTNKLHPPLDLHIHHHHHHHDAPRHDQRPRQPRGGLFPPRRERAPFTLRHAPLRQLLLPRVPRRLGPRRCVPACVRGWRHAYRRFFPPPPRGCASVVFTPNARQCNTLHT